MSEEEEEVQRNIHIFATVCYLVVVVAALFTG